MWVDGVLLAAGHHTTGDPAGAVLGLIVIVVLFVILAVRAASARYDVAIRNGLPYCPRCNRQVSIRRDYCRACGHRFVTYGSPQPSDEEIQRERSRRAWEAQIAAEQQRRDQQEAELRKSARLLKARERDEAYREAGIKPGPLAWFWAWPDLAQAALLGLTIAIPAVTILLLIFARSKADPPAPSANVVLPAGTPALPPDATVYVTRRGTRYHKKGCSQLFEMGTPLTFREATQEFVPCRECWLDGGPVAVVPPEKPKGGHENAQPINALAAIPVDAAKADAPPVGPRAANPPARVATAPVAAPAGRAPAPVVLATPAPAIRVRSIHAPKRDYRRTAKVEYRNDVPIRGVGEPPFGTTATGIPTYTGPRGGVYHYSASGRKVYESSRGRRR